MNSKLLSLDEAIKHCYDVAKRKCNDCGEEHLQLAAWLEELKELRDVASYRKIEIERLHHILVSFMDEVAMWGNKHNINTSMIPKLVLLGEEQENTLSALKTKYTEEIESLKRRLSNSQLHEKETTKLLKDERLHRVNENYIELQAVKLFWETLKHRESTMDKRIVSVAVGDSIIKEMEKDCENQT